MSLVTLQLGNLKPLPDRVFIKNLEHGITRSPGGILIPDDDMKERGIKSRWAEVYKVGEGIEDLKPGEFVLLKHGRWTRGMKVEDEGEELIIWMIDYPNAVLVIHDKEPEALRNFSIELNTLCSQ